MLAYGVLKGGILATLLTALNYGNPSLCDIFCTSLLVAGLGNVCNPALSCCYTSCAIGLSSSRSSVLHFNHLSLL